MFYFRFIGRLKRIYVNTYQEVCLISKEISRKIIEYPPVHIISLPYFDRCKKNPGKAAEANMVRIKGPLVKTFNSPVRILVAVT